MADCDDLQRVYEQLLAGLLQEWASIPCSRFGWAVVCGNREFTCPDLAANMTAECETRRRETIEVALCRSRAAGALVQTAADAALAARLRSLNDYLERANELLRTFAEPRRLFTKLLSPSSDLYRALIRPEQPEGVDARLAEEVYRFVDNYARLGVRVQPSGVIQAFQRSALEALARHFAMLQSELDSALHQIASISQDIDSTAAAPRGRPANIDSTAVAPPGGPAKPTGSADCSVLLDQAASRRLMEENSELWLALTARCKQ